MKQLTSVAILMALALPAAAQTQHDGMLGCGGQSVLLSGGTGGNSVYTIYQFTNFNDTETISIDRVIVFNEAGGILCDFPGVTPFPARMNATLGPHASTSVATINMPCMPPAAFPGQDLSAIVYWSYVGKGERRGLSGTAVQQVLDVATNSHLGRSAAACRELRP